MDLKFQQWLMEHNPDDKYIFKSAWWDQYVFWRDKILPMFTDAYYKSGKSFSWENVEKEIDTNVEIIGEHYSKSLIHPVVKINYRGATIIANYNFYGYEVEVFSDYIIQLPMSNLFRSKKAGFFWYGYPEKWITNERYEDNKKTFVAEINDLYDFYTFMYLLQRQIYKNSKRRK